MTADPIVRKVTKDSIGVVGRGVMIIVLVAEAVTAATAVDVARDTYYSGSGVSGGGGVKSFVVVFDNPPDPPLTRCDRLAPSVRG